jgi:hypothetical protein
MGVDCLGCVTAYKVSSGVCVCDDVNGYFPNSLTGTCELCSDLVVGCLSCSYNAIFSMVDCLSCDTSYLQSMVNGQLICVPCTPPCSACSGSQTTCSTCLTGYSGPPVCSCSSCQAGCTTGCMTCDNTNATICFTCLIGHYLDNTACLPCPSNCLVCGATSPICLICDTSFMVSNTGGCVCNNGLGLFLDTGSGSCQPCSAFGSITNCQTCVDTTGAGAIECQTCLSGYFAQTTMACASCGANCLACTSTLSCSPGGCAATFNAVVGGNCYCDNLTVFYDGVNT